MYEHEKFLTTRSIMLHVPGVSRRCAVVLCLHICRNVGSVLTFLRIKADCFYKGGKSVNLSMGIAYEMNHIHDLRL